MRFCLQFANEPRILLIERAEKQACKMAFVPENIGISVV